MKKVDSTRYLVVYRKTIQGTCFLFCFIFYLSLHAQKNLSYLDISKIQFSVSLKDSNLFEFSDSDISDSAIPSLKFSKSFSSTTTEKNIYVKLSLCNSSDSAQEIFFSPGFYFTNIKIFKSNPDNSQDNLLSLRKNELGKNLNIGLILLKLEPKEKANFFLIPTQLKSDAIFTSPQIINKNFILYYKNNLSNKTINLITYVVSGILLMMIFYSLGAYFQNAKLEFLYCSAYAFFMGLLIFLKSYLYNDTSIVNYYFEGYFDFMLEAFGFLFYIGFIRKFLKTAEKYPVLEKTFKACQLVTIGLIIIFSIVSFASNSFFFAKIIENITKLMLIELSIFFIIYGLSKNDKLMSYLILGQIMLIAFAILSFVIATAHITILNRTNPIFNEPMLYYEAGIVLELIFFVTGLAYKNNTDIVEHAKESVLLKVENERKEFEKQIAVAEAKNNERNRISADMHDDLGSGITAIKMMSENVKRKMGNQPLPEIEKISCSANELLEKMSTIIWTMNTSNDSAESLITYTRVCAVELFENTPIDCNVSIPSSIPSIEINGEKRRNIFLSFKESLNNILKHSKACHVNIDISIREKLVIEIADDGIGIDTEKLRRFGNGICNIKKRMESIEGSFEIKSQNGTTVILSMKL